VREAVVSVYAVVVFVHVVSAIALVGSTLFDPLFGAGVRRARTTQGLREWARVLLTTGQWAGRAAPVTFLTGLYLAFAGDWWGSGWLEVSLILFVLAGVGALGFLEPAAKRLVAAADAAPDGPVGADLEALRHDRRTTVVESFLLPGDLTIVFLMTNKPGFTGAFTAMAVAALAGAVLLALHHAPQRQRMPAT
jgi:hypothetical protein